MARLDRAAGRAGMRASFASGAPELVPGAAGVDGALARLLAIVAASAEQGTWERLKACPRDCCLWAFYDKSKNHSKRWCSMESCGNVEKARAFRQRRRSAPAEDAGSGAQPYSTVWTLKRFVPAGGAGGQAGGDADHLAGPGHAGVHRRPGAGVDQAERVHRLLVEHRVDAPHEPAAAHHVEARRQAPGSGPCGR